MAQKLTAMKGVNDSPLDDMISSIQKGQIRPTRILCFGLNLVPKLLPKLKSKHCIVIFCRIFGAKVYQHIHQTISNKNATTMNIGNDTKSSPSLRHLNNSH